MCWPPWPVSACPAAPTPRCTTARPPAPESGPPDFHRLLQLSSREHRLWIDSGPYQLYEAEGCRWLSDAHEAIQTAVCLSDPGYPLLPNHRAMLLAELCTPSPGAVLDLGSGGGGFCRYFLQRNPVPRIDAVEQDALMIALAYRYFLLPADQAVMQSTAQDFLRAARERYDLVFCDLFVGRRSPPALCEADFFAALAERLAPRGTLALNTLPRSARELQAILHAARAVFAGVAVLQFAELGNIALLLQRQPLPAREVLIGRFEASPGGSDEDLRDCLRSMRYL